MPRRLKTGSRYDTGSVSVVSIAKVVGETTFYQSNSIPDVKFLDNLIGWMLTNASEVHM